MLKCRFRVSLDHLLTGYRGLVSARKSVLPITSIQLKGFESLKRSLHTSTDDEDAFAELGLPVERVGGLIQKLVTGKPEPFLKANGTEKKVRRSPVNADGCLKIMDVLLKVEKSSVPSLDLQNNNDGRSNFRTSHSATITDAPSVVNSHELEEVISVCDEVLKASMRSVPNGLGCCDIEFMNINGTEKKLHQSPVKAAVGLKVNDILLKVQKSSVPSPDLQNNNDGISNLRTSHTVTIKNVPSIIDSHELMKAMSVFGKVSKVFKKSVPNGLDCCDIEFKHIKSIRKALSVGSITVKKFPLSILPLHPLESVTIRISNISLKTAESAIHSTCKLCGLFKGLVRTKDDAVDALFTVTGESDMHSIIAKLNTVVMHKSKWSAHLQHNESPSMATTENGKAEDDLGFKIGGHLADLERELLMKQSYVEDLLSLHGRVLHIENHPLKADVSSPSSTESEL